MLKKHIVVQVRGTPTSGKTVLARLLHERVKMETDLRPVYIQWLEDGRSGAYEDKLQAWSGGALGRNLLADKNLVLIVDEAQFSYEQLDFWIGCVKYQSTATGGPYIILFSSYGSADSVAVTIPGSAPVTLEPFQRVSLTHQVNQPYNVCLFLTPDEFEDVCSRWAAGHFELSGEVKNYLYNLTSGHAGLCNGLLSTILDLKEVRAARSASDRITMASVHRFFDNDTILLDAVKSRVRRSPPQKSALSNETIYPGLSSVLRKAIIENGIEATDPAQVPGLIAAYKLGYLQSESVEEETTFYDFPTRLHRRYAASLLLDGEYDGVEYQTVRDLCFAALENFSPRQLKNHPRKPKFGTQIASAPAPEAQYQSEMYRALHVVTGGRCLVHSEFSYTTRRKIDFFLNKRTWGVEVMREGDRLQNHLDRFRPNGAYGSWKLVTD
ncbi:hypothetical protein FQN53_001220 [Emmonsiellopsis sp. PD_33]|nr:hypothetical protein FQN53_001220 [Emmonsiellopsis sp. PD_33]